MKFKLLVKLIEKLLGVADDGEDPRADVFLPDKLLAMSLVFILVGIGCGVYAAFNFAVWAVIGCALGFILGIFAMLSWKNQRIYVISEEQFTYTTMFGRTHTYSFSDIQGFRKNNDSLTIFVAGKKVHIESMALISERFITLVDKALEKNG